MFTDIVFLNVETSMPALVFPKHVNDILPDELKTFSVEKWENYGNVNMRHLCIRWTPLLGWAEDFGFLAYFKSYSGFGDRILNCCFRIDNVQLYKLYASNNQIINDIYSACKFRSLKVGTYLIENWRNAYSGKKHVRTVNNFWKHACASEFTAILPMLKILGARYCHNCKCQLDDCHNQKYL